MNRVGLILDLMQFAVGAVAVFLYFQCSSILDTVFLVCGLSVVLIPLQYFSNRIHEKTGLHSGDGLEQVKKAQN